MSDANDPETHHNADPSDMHPVARALFGWVSWKGTPAFFFWGLLGLGAALVLADLVANRKDYFDVAESFGFYALYGFGAFAFVVLMGWPLGALLRRGEDYYGDHEDPTPGNSGQGGRSDV